MDSPFLFRIFLLLMVIAMLPGAALAIESQAEMGPCPCNLSGHVVSWSCIWEKTEPIYPYKLPNVEVRVTDCMGGATTAVTDEQGYFEFPCVHNPTDGCPFCFRTTNVDVAGYITAFDASIILRYLVNLETLDKCPYDTAKGLMYPQMVAADVNCQNGINAYDAALILMYTVGTIDHFDCGDDWVCYPAPNCVTECVDDVTLYCICIGDVSGPSSGPSFLMAAEPASVMLGVPSHFGNFVKVPVKVTGAEDVSSAQFTMAFDPAEFEVANVETGELTGGTMAAYHADGGLLYVAMAGTAYFSGDGEIAIITLEKKRPMINAALNRLMITEARLNEDFPIIVSNDTGAPEIFKLSLGPISPNPAADGTAISFNISHESAVSLSIYNVEGELVRTLLSGRAQAGPNQINWDGTDADGDAVGRGIYFCRIQAGAMSTTEKIVLIQ